MPWTPAQQAAIDARNTNILVSAAAGSGKTAVLSERVFKRVLGNEKEAPIDIDRMLIVTFTSAAANEMKERIGDKISEYIEALQEKAELTEDEYREVVYLEKQIALLSKASISTIHSFCLKLIKAYFNELDIDPNIRVGNEQELTMIKYDVLDELLEECFEGESNEGFLKVADTYGSVRGMEPLIEKILEIHTFSKSTVFPSRWLEEKTALLTAGYDSIEDTPWSKQLADELTLEIDEIEGLYQQAIKLCNAPDGPKAYEEALQSDLVQLQAINKNSLEGIVEGLSKISFVALSRKKQECDAVLKENVKGYRNSAKDMIKALQESTSTLTDEMLLQKTREAGLVIAELVKLVELFDQRYGEAKKEKGLVDYNDLEHLALRLLVTVDDEGNIHYTDIAKEQSTFYEEVYIDEYQDSNLVQETILGAIAKAARDQGATQFMVGDMKQSIYRFRLANPLIFASKYETWDKYDEDVSLENACIDLSKNFRSRHNVLQGINDVFEQVMSKQVGELVYNEEAKLHTGNMYTDGVTKELEAGLADKIELHLLESVAVEESEAGEVENLAAVEMEAKMVATQIERLLRGESNPRYVFDKTVEKEGGYRSIEPKDIVVLLRSKTNAAIFEEALLSKGIDAYAEINSDFFEAMEVKTLLSLLQIIDNPLQDIPLIAVLRSPIVDLDYDELVKIRHIDDKCSFYEVFKQYVALEDADHNAVQFYEQLRAYRDLSSMLDVSELIDQLLVETGYYRYVGALPAGAKKKANLRLLKQYAEDFEKNNSTRLFGFLSYLNRLTESGAKLEQAKVAGGGENFVNIMTIHKSKGLEFPIVFLSESAKKFNNEDMKKDLILHNEEGFGPKHFDYENYVLYRTIPFVAIRNKIRAENISEEMRVLYVALTRAKEKLFITGAVKNIEKRVAKWAQYATRNQDAISPLGIRKCATYLDWIGLSLYGLSSFEGVRAYIGENPDHLFKGESRWDFVCWDTSDIGHAEELTSEALKEKKEILEHWDTTISYTDQKEEIFNKLSYTYPYQIATTMPTTVTVTKLKKSKQDQDIITPRQALLQTDVEEYMPTFMKQQEVVIKGARKGTLIHSVLEELDYMKIRSAEQIQQALYQLVRENKLKEEVLEVVDIKRLESMANSSVVEEMRSAEGVYKEKPFVYLLDATKVDPAYPEDEKVLLQGIVDLYYVKDNKVYLVDYKTDYIDNNDRAAGIERIKHLYKDQLTLYSEALENILKQEVEKRYIYLYSIDEWITI